MKKSIKKLGWSKVVKYAKNKKFYPFLYYSFYHSFLRTKNIDLSNIYFTAIPNPGAGIGHQMANWIAGYWWGKQFRLKYAYAKFSDSAWDEFLGFGEKETSIEKLLLQGFKRVQLPLFNEDNQTEIFTTKKIIESYAGKKIVFVAEQDQFYRDQFGISGVLQKKFFSASSRKNDELIYNNTVLNVAIHVRRGDIIQRTLSKPKTNPHLLKRYQENEYFINILSHVLLNIKTDKPVHVYLFSQGKESDFSEFYSIQNLHFCLDMNTKDSFLHMVYADVLITSKSSFSYKPALINRGLKICPKDFWHGYPSSNDFVLADEKGNLLNELKYNFHDTVL